jgi:hypothetical protein
LTVSRAAARLDNSVMMVQELFVKYPKNHTIKLKFKGGFIDQGIIAAKSNNIIFEILRWITASHAYPVEE